MSKNRIAVDLSDDETKHLDDLAVERFGDSHRRRADVVRILVRESKARKAKGEK